MNPGALALQVGHEREHCHRVPARRVRLGVQHHLLARLDERLLGHRAPEKLRDRVGDLVPRPAESRVVGVARLGQGGRRRLAHDAPSPSLGVLVGLHHLLELEEQGGVLVPAEQPEQHPVAQLERPARARPAQLEQAAILGNGADVLDALRGRRGQAEQVSAPDAGVLLLLDDRQRGLGFGHGGVGRRDRFRARHTPPASAR